MVFEDCNVAVLSSITPLCFCSSLSLFLFARICTFRLSCPFRTGLEHSSVRQNNHTFRGPETTISFKYENKSLNDINSSTVVMQYVLAQKRIGPSTTVTEAAPQKGELTLGHLMFHLELK